MSNVNVCMSCGIEVFVGVDAERDILIGYCDCSAVPEVDVFVPEDMPCCSEVNEVFCDVCGDFGPDVCSCSLPVFCVVCDTCTCNGKCDSKVEIEDEEFIYVYEESEVLASYDGPEPRHEKVRPLLAEVFIMLAILVSFFRLLYAISTGKVNDPSLVIAWYAFCGYLILSYTAVILWFVL